MVRGIGLAEELAQDSLVAALENWPVTGIPDKPGAWLMTTAKRRALDYLRHQKLAALRHAELSLELDAQHAFASAEFNDQVDAALDDHVGDDLLGLIFTACHPLLSPESRWALRTR